MLGESDRGSVLVAASQIEWQMGEIIKATLLNRHEEQTESLCRQIDLMLDPTAEKSILGSAAARARMCFALNLITEETHKAIKQFLSFRNQHFAHARQDVSFEQPAIKKSLQDLISVISQSQPVINEAIEGSNDGRHLFRAIVACLYSSIHNTDAARGDFDPESGKFGPLDKQI
jgi:hypothetical protein